MLVVDQRHQQMLERRIFVAPLAGFAKGVVQGLFELGGETWHSGSSPTNGADAGCNVIRLSGAIKGRGGALSPDYVRGGAGLRLLEQFLGRGAMPGRLVAVALDPGDFGLQRFDPFL